MGKRGWSLHDPPHSRGFTAEDGGVQCCVPYATMSEVAVVLSGCGVFDGTEVHEISAVCAALSRAGKNMVFFAPDKPLFHEVNHVNGQDGATERNCLIESARIARGKVAPVSELKASDFAAVVFPGGFGAAKNLSNFATSSDPSVDEEVARVISEFHAEKKPMAFCCIAPVLVALVLGKGGTKVKLTLGKTGEKWPYGGTIEKVTELGCECVEMEVSEVCVDEENKIVSSPAFMYDGAFHEIQDGVSKMVDELVKIV